MLDANLASKSSHKRRADLEPLSMQVLDFELQRQLVPYMKDLQPLPGIYDPDFIAANQDARADNLIKGSKQEQVSNFRKT